MTLILGISCLLLSVAAVGGASVKPYDIADDLITSLPGIDENSVTFSQYSGYLDGKDGNMLHYWLTESQMNPAGDPLLLWLNGGPGCSSLDGLLTELGPFRVNEDGQTLTTNPNSWNSFANVLFLESPACVGFSYNQENDCSASDDSTATANYNALLDFFSKFTYFQDHDFYVTGESYGGIYVPTLTAKILSEDNDIQLKGFAVGNGMSDFGLNDESLLFFGNYHGLFGKDLWSELVTNCCDGKSPTRGRCHFTSSADVACNTAVNKGFDMVYSSGLNVYNLYDACAVNDGSSDIKISRYGPDIRMPMRNPISQKQRPKVYDGTPCISSGPATIYLQSQDVREALHISDLSAAWEVCNPKVEFQYDTTYQSVAEVYKTISEAEVRGLVYNGDVDMACNFIGDKWFVEDLEYDVIHPNQEWVLNGQVGGWVKQFKNLDLLTVRGSGHMVPKDKPEYALHMIKSFVEGTGYGTLNETLREIISGNVHDNFPGFE